MVSFGVSLVVLYFLCFISIAFFFVDARWLARSLVKKKKKKKNEK